MRPKTLSLCVMVALLAAGALAAPPHRGWTKLELTAADGAPTAAPLALLAAAGGQDVADYGSFRIVAVPESAVDGLTRKLAAAGIRVRRRDELDRIDAPGASVDARLGIDPAVPQTQLIHDYVPGRNGLYLVQLIGPAQAEWPTTLRSLGWTLTRYLPNDAYVVAGPPALAARTRLLPFVQFFDFYHPFEKDALLPHDAEPHDFILALPTLSDAQETIDAVRAAAEAGSVSVDRYEHDTYVRARLTPGKAAELLHDPLIISIEAVPVMGLSDERQATSLTSNLNTAGSQPTTPTGYLSWLTSRCSNCSAANMPASTWRVAMADTGLDGGTYGAHHADLAGREFWGNMYVSANDNCANGRNDCDVVTHGTLVAGIMAGNASLGSTDPLGYYDGRGVAPGAGVFVTKIFSYVNGAQPTNDIFTWATDAANGGATIQNHSWNNYGDTTNYGRYSLMSRNFDLASRDVDNNGANGRTPMLFSVAAGNRDPNTPANTLAIPPATAKNVLSMGGVENYRPERDTDNCRNSQADDFRNLMTYGRHGTLISGYFKPDLVAPASYIVSTKSQWNPSSAFYCDSNFDGGNYYQMESGTSFAAPVGAASALLVKRYLGTSPSSVSPALAKAALIAGARSIKGGLDRTVSPAVTIGAMPNSQQGFGRISLDAVLTGSTPPSFYEESTSRQFATTGQTWTARLAVRDSAKPVVLALVWSDPAGAEGSTSPLVNNLNLVVKPVGTANCTYFQGNSIGTTDEQSISYACTATAPVDSANNVEYARFSVSGYTQFDVSVAMGNYGDTLGDAQPFALVAINADPAESSSGVAPQLTATADATTPANIHLTWTSARNVVVTRYDVSRGSTLSDLAVVPALQTSGSVLAQDDNGRPSGVHTWLYRVTAVTPSSSLASNIDIATTQSFNASDDVLDIVRTVHFTRLMEAINAVRAAAGLAAASFTAPAPDATPRPVVTKEHLKNLRDALDVARDSAHLNLPAIVYQEPTSSIVVGQTTIKHKQIEELRDGVK